MASEYPELGGTRHVFWSSGHSWEEDTWVLAHPMAFVGHVLPARHGGDTSQPLGALGPQAGDRSLETKNEGVCVCFVLLRLPENSG